MSDPRAPAHKKKTINTRPPSVTAFFSLHPATNIMSSTITTTLTPSATGYRLNGDVLEDYKFKPIREAEVNREMTHRYMTDMLEYAESDVVIVGAGR